MKQTYNERVRALAEKMAQDKYSKLFGMNNRGTPAIRASEERMIEEFIPAARIAVAEREAGFKDGWAACENKVFGTGKTVETELKEHGLIPDQEPPKESAFEKVDAPTVGAMVDRSQENYTESPIVTVTLPCGYTARFWYVGLSDEEYIRRTERLKDLDNGLDNMTIKKQEGGRQR